MTPEFRLQTFAGPLTARHFTAPWGSTTTAGVVLTSLPPGSDGAVSVRLQSSCLFSEAFRTADCDCALQLCASIKLLGVEDGIVVYAYQEGRGAGLELKCRSIMLQQEKGLHTAAAYRELGLPTDLRDFEVEAAVLREFLQPSQDIRLLTNNPRKVEQLSAHGFTAVSRRPLVMKNPSVRDYLDEKQKVLGHLIDDVEDGDP